MLGLQLFEDRHGSIRSEDLLKDHSYRWTHFDGHDWKYALQQIFGTLYFVAMSKRACAFKQHAGLVRMIRSHFFDELNCFIELASSESFSCVV